MKKIEKIKKIEKNRKIEKKKLKKLYKTLLIQVYSSTHMYCMYSYNTILNGERYLPSDPW